MLRLRVLTAAVLVPLIVWATFALTTPQLAGLFAFFFIAAAWEWTALCGLSRRLWRILYVAVLASAGLALWQVPALPVMLAAVAWWLWALYELVRYPDLRQGFLATPFGRRLSGFFILIPAWIAPLAVHARGSGGPRLTLFIMVLVWMADSGAYFVGRPWGRTKIAPHISPGKSLEGLLGGVVMVSVLALACGKYIWKLKAPSLALWLVIAVVATLFSVLGDLVESRAKRIAGVKDSGTLLPGHGGVLDRVDALTAAAPVFVFGWLLLRPLL
ncbi:MAG: phosphatidate cytidylyltransferase [Gammaproteobacteria bacterium]|nr:phosphatidate cytidylyltransferase [Gammaproteobacteria bacterium]